MTQRILIVDDDAGHRLMLETLLTKWGFSIASARSGLEAVNLVQGKSFGIVLMDLRMEGMDGLTALKEIKTLHPDLPVLMMTAYSAVDTAIAAMKQGAHDYLLKPLDFDVLKNSLQELLEPLPKATSSNTTVYPNGIIGNSPLIQQMQHMIAKVAPSEATVLITGKSGTGKELVAQAIHQQSKRHTKPFVAVNCAALSENLLESELFGHEKGAFTGADKCREGRFLQAQGGTLFLDEIGEIPLSMQVKLLRVIQQREIQRVGGDKTLQVDVRLVAATNRTLLDEVKAGNFREDLYYRLNVVTIQVPSLAERSTDVPLLVKHFLEKFNQRNHKHLQGFTPEAMQILQSYAWPGNVRELENVLERAVILSTDKQISVQELPPNLKISDQKKPPKTMSSPNEGTLDEAERDLILQTLQQANDNKSEAAKRLGISRKTLHSKLKKYLS